MAKQPPEEIRLARKIWPHVRKLDLETFGGRSDAIEIGNSSTLVFACECDHPKAREAILAALRVLAGEDSHG